MCTLMQKDVLIEAIAVGSSIAVNKKQINTPQATRLRELRNFVYSTSPNNIDYQATLQEVLSLKQSLETLPNLRLMQ